MQFSNFLDLTQNLEKNKSLCIEENFLWAKNINLPNIDLGLPSIEKTSKILMLNDRITPIYIQLEDGSKLFFTYDEFKRIHGNPMIGKKMHLVMQRLGNDTSKYPSKITSCRVID
jgi:hypothetical protein